MDVLLLEPNGYCSGVQRAFSLALRLRKEQPNVEIYCLGMLVHNEDSMMEFQNYHIHIIDERKENLEVVLKSIPDGSYVIFSAHGHPLGWEKLAAEKNLKILDCTCPFVEANRVAGASLKSSFFYFGVKGHLEADAFMANNPDAIFLDVVHPELQSIDITPSIVYPAICQTTISGEEIESAISFLSKKGISIQLIKSQCQSTYLRQKAIMDLPESITTLVVLGSPRSNNSVKLYEIGVKKNLRCYLVRNLSELQNISFKKGERIALSSGASTSSSILKECYDYLSAMQR